MTPDQIPDLPPYAPPPVSIVIGSGDGPPPRLPRLNGLRRLIRHLREQVKQVTGWGQWAAHRKARQMTRQHIQSNQPGRRISFLAAGDPSARRILFIHGSPGYGADWQTYLGTCPKDQYRIAVDRLGYGDSRPNRAEPSVLAQAEAIAPLLTPGCLVVGHSYGAVVALRLALNAPDLVAGVMVIGCPIDTEREHVHILQRLAASHVMGRVLPGYLWVSSNELLPFQSDLQALVPDLSRLTLPVTIVQGERDTLVPADNAEMLQKFLSKSAKTRLIRLKNNDHYVPWTAPQIIEKSLCYLLRDLAAAGA